MTIGDYNGGHRSSWRELFRRWTTIDHLCSVATLLFVLLGAGIFWAAYIDYVNVLYLITDASQKYAEPGLTANSVDPAKLEVGVQTFNAARAQLLSADAITFLVELMIVIVLTVGIKVFSGSEKKLKKAEEHITWSELRHGQADGEMNTAKARLDLAQQIYRQLASFMGATGASQLASTLASMVDRNLDRLAKEFAVSAPSGQEEAVVGVMGDWIKSLKETLTDSSLVEIGIPRPTFNALCERVGQIDKQLKTIDLALDRNLADSEERIDAHVRNWLIASNAPEPHDPKEGARRLREIASLMQTLFTFAGTDAEALASMVKPRLLPHELDNYAALMASIEVLRRMDSDLQRVQTQQTNLHRLQQTINECREALREDLCRHWEEFIKKLNSPPNSPAPTIDRVAPKDNGSVPENGK